MLSSSLGFTVVRNKNTRQKAGRSTTQRAVRECFRGRPPLEEPVSVACTTAKNRTSVKCTITFTTDLLRRNYDSHVQRRRATSKEANYYRSTVVIIVGPQIAPNLSTFVLPLIRPPETKNINTIDSSFSVRARPTCSPPHPSAPPSGQVVSLSPGQGPRWNPFGTGCLSLSPGQGPRWNPFGTGCLSLTWSGATMEPIRPASSASPSSSPFRLKTRI
jgi:hypothetical protein